MLKRNTFRVLGKETHAYTIGEMSLCAPFLAFDPVIQLAVGSPLGERVLGVSAMKTLHSPTNLLHSPPAHSLKCFQAFMAFGTPDLYHLELLNQVITPAALILLPWWGTPGAAQLPFPAVSRRRKM